jgi:hypothetical protein
VFEGIYTSGWTSIMIRTVYARREGTVILVANEYVAAGSGFREGQCVAARSRHVLVRSGGEWLSAMHTAT